VLAGGLEALVVLFVGHVHGGCDGRVGAEAKEGLGGSYGCGEGGGRDRETHVWKMM
jgi:hypothetical protein